MFAYDRFTNYWEFQNGEIEITVKDAKINYEIKNKHIVFTFSSDVLSVDPCYIIF